MNWLPLRTASQIEEIVEQSFSTTCIIYKHSTRCSLSSLAKHRLEREWPHGERLVLPYFLDLIANREVSSLVAQYFGVTHQSPQLLLIQEGRCIYHSSHLNIEARSLDAYFFDNRQKPGH
ncbi:MAG: bacillithiol system redox-active protein YtxJ [Lewinellaceae bacterium]|nr:bacillithiol system redox-active protein YtxJ [Lewinellaceae bacterium]